MKKLNYTTKYKNINKQIMKRLNILQIIIIILISILFVCLFINQIIKNKYYKNKLDTLVGNIVEGSTAPRGYIYDRNHKLLVSNIPIKVIYYNKPKNISAKEEISIAYMVANIVEVNFDHVTDYELRNFWVKKNNEDAKKLIKEKEYEDYHERKITYQDIENLKRERIDISNLSDLDKEAAYIYALMNRGYSYLEKIIKTNCTDREYIEIGTSNIKGFNVKFSWERNYLYGDTFKLILGTVSTSEVGLPSDLKDYYLKKGYQLDDRVGTSYLEYQYDDYLKGIKNKYRLNKFNDLELISEGEIGNSLVLTIDIDLQKQVEEVLVDELIKAKQEPNTKYYNRSFVIITDPKTGEILAMAGKQILEINGEYQIFDYTPGILTAPVVVGSIIKGASQIVGYNTGALEIGEQRYDRCVKLKGAPEKCSWKSLGLLNDLTALKQSSNTYQFYTALKVAGVDYYPDMPFNPDKSVFDTYRDTFKEFGLGVKTGIDLPVESTGYKGTSEVGGLLLDFAIGQYDNYTPIQLSQYIGTIANNGVRMQPYLLKEVYKDINLTDQIYENKPVELNKINTEQVYLDRVKEGFKMVLEYGGTGSGYIDHNYHPAGKTGTSQSFVDSDNDGNIDKETITNTFAGYAPYEDPKVTFTVISPDIYYNEGYSTYQTNVNKRISKRISDIYFSNFND